VIFVVALLPALVVLVPLGLAFALAAPAARPVISRLAPLAAVPALVLALAPELGLPTTELEAPAVLLGARLAVVDTLTRGFLAFTAVLWVVAAWFAHAYVAGQPRRTSFLAWLFVTMAGNLGAIVARDMAGFYLFFAMMSLASYGLVIHERTPAARRAANTYLVLALLGDVMILAAMLAIAPGAANLAIDEVGAAIAASPFGELAAWLLFVGFGVKAGAVLPLHVWLPLAHPVAPTPASALLSGAMIKVGLLGWLRFLPLGELALPELGSVWIVAGVTAAFYGAALGVTHRDPKTVLAYSSISQMGMMMIAVGVTVAEPAAHEVAAGALLVFAGHHAFAKAALFLGTALAKAGAGDAAPARSSPVARWLVTVALVVPALEIAGAPLSSGALGKLALKDVLGWHPHGSALAVALSCAAIGSTLLMARFLALTIPRRAIAAPRAGLWLPVAALLVLDIALFARGAHLSMLASPATLWSAAWPVLAGAVIALAARTLSRRGWRLPAVPAGDVVGVFEWTIRRLQAVLAQARGTAAAAEQALRELASHLVSSTARSRYGRWLDRAEATLSRFPVVGLALAVLAAVLIFAASRS
jgi:formate hydrogenlyase subunit 3/multisubunit Na+/H+ antiporter MnhD subunit